MFDIPTSDVRTQNKSYIDHNSVTTDCPVYIFLNGKGRK